MSLTDYSNPTKVKSEGRKHGLTILQSTRPGKKYMFEHDKKIVHFGQMGYEDYTKHKDEERRNRFLRRNARWKTAEKYTPAWASYHLLW